jgi:hypothetical protein
MKKIIKQLRTMAMFAAGALMACQSAFGANFVADDLYFGFENQTGGGREDYIINLGPASGIVGGSSVLTFNSDLSQTDINVVFGASSSMFGGVVGGNGASNPTSDFYVTQLRTSNVGNPALAGSSLSATMTRSQDNQAAGALSNLGGLINLPAPGAGLLDTNKTWEEYVEPNDSGTPQSVLSISGVNPDSSVSKTTALYEDLWFTSSSTLTGGKSFTYEGYFTLNLTGASPVLTFTPMNAPGTLTPPIIKSISVTGTTVTLISSNAVATHTYQLQYTTSLSPVSWQSIGTAVTANGTTVTNTDTTATGAERFYKILAQ